MLPAIPWLVQAGIAAIASYGGYFVYEEHLKSVDGSFKIQKLKFDLNINIFGQTEALNALVNNLATPGPSHYHAWVIILYGGPGVGKTLALSLVRENYEPSKMVVSLLQQNFDTLPSQPVNAKEQVMLKIMGHVGKLSRVNGVALVTIDNADIDRSDLWEFVARLNEFCWQYKVRVKVLIAVQLFQDVTSSESAKNVISNTFKNSDEYVNFAQDKYKNACAQYKNCRTVMFRPIGIETLKMCINAAAKSMSGVALKEDQMAYLVGQISEAGLDYIPGGCKTVENYVALLHDSP